ncbi:MAG: M67 family metallopeptidase [Firmicutes bacterium]|nr:M67 family metallopeptidase [Bacillota bacterium]
MEIPETLCRQMLVFAKETLPNEACGLIGGFYDKAVRFYPTPNAAASPTRYCIDPQVLYETLQRIGEEGCSLVGIFHSHPYGPPTPSQTDVALAYYPQAVYLIASGLETHQPVLRAFRIIEGRVEEEPLIVQPTLSQTGRLPPTESKET